MGSVSAVTTSQALTGPAADRVDTGGRRDLPARVGFAAALTIAIAW